MIENVVSHFGRFRGTQNRVVLCGLRADQFRHPWRDLNVPVFVGAKGMPALVPDLRHFMLQLSEPGFSLRQQLPCDRGGRIVYYALGCWMRRGVTVAAVSRMGIV